jgi:hypothetical protein
LQHRHVFPVKRILRREITVGLLISRNLANALLQFLDVFLLPSTESSLYQAVSISPPLKELAVEFTYLSCPILGGALGLGQFSLTPAASGFFLGLGDGRCLLSSNGDRSRGRGQHLLIDDRCGSDVRLWQRR